MILWDPVENLISRLEYLRQQYRCLVDGEEVFLGEALPTGLEGDILLWIEARYKLLGLLFFIGYASKELIHENNLLIDPEMWGIVPSTKRYLVEVKGTEKMFVLHPIDAGSPCWILNRALVWDGK